MSKLQVLVCKHLEQVILHEVWFFGDELIDICASYNYFGITIISGTITNHAINVSTGQVKKASGALVCQITVIG
jgi:hypothetical protein